MERRNFLSYGVTSGLALSCLPTFSHAQEGRRKKPLKPFSVPPREPLTPGPGNVDIRTIVRSNPTGMQFSNVEIAVAPMHMGVPPHVHKELDELMYVLEGTATILIGDEIYEVEAGGWNFRPHGIVHSFWNASERPLRCIDCYFNQNFEDFLEELFHQIIPDMVNRNLTPDAPEIANRVDALHKKFGITMFADRAPALIEKYGLRG